MKTLKKPKFSVDQIVPASKAARGLKDIRKRAKEMPQFITENNHIDSVLINYETYESMHMELEMLREANWQYQIKERLHEAEDSPADRYTADQVMSEQEYENFRHIDPDSLADEDLFDDE